MQKHFKKRSQLHSKASSDGSVASNEFVKHALFVRDLNVFFGDHHVLQDVSFTLKRGETFVIIGPNGSGKTVLLKSLLHLIPFSGSVTWSPDTRIGYVPQKIDADRHLPINLENLLGAKAAILGCSRKEIFSVSEDVGLDAETLKTPVGHLSGGNFQKALIAFALLGDPTVIIFDEPTASLDELAEEHVYDLMDVLRKKRGLTIVLVSHDLSLVPALANTVLCLNKVAICLGPPQEALTKEIFAKLYQGPHKFYSHSSSHRKILDQRHHDDHLE